ncbi:50S ribosomal protein L23 [candidate division GN15 bacterium]|nr:50S ribosomal protein L23 [candidate division GN15 bacterium]
MKDLRGILKTHITTERTTLLREANNEYVFEVKKTANKHQIKQAVEQAFKVQVDSVRTVNVPGKPRRMGRFEGKTPTWKKAIVRLKKDQVITIFENV